MFHSFQDEKRRLNLKIRLKLFLKFKFCFKNVTNKKESFRIYFGQKFRNLKKK